MRTTLHSTLLFDCFVPPNDDLTVSAGTAGNNFLPDINGESQILTYPAEPVYTTPYNNTLSFGAPNTQRGVREFNPYIAFGDVYEMKIEGVSGWNSFNYGSLNSWVSANTPGYLLSQPTGQFIGPATATMTLKFRHAFDSTVVGGITVTVTSAT